jgi:sulfate adenylyltransferase subunit 1
MTIYNESQAGYMNMELLRFTTAGSVDDGKSTLIGRLLYDSKAIFQDQLDALELASKHRGEETLNLAFLTDGLRAEREQGITIDVAYRYFATPKRKFIIADTPGHIQYTRNMVTGASTANAALILVDARNGVIEQTLRHTFIASLLQIPHIIVCVNKMDLVNFDESAFLSIRDRIEGLSDKLNNKDIHFIPISARDGDNVVDRSKNMPWYSGPTLMHLLETVDIGNDYNLTDARFPVQYIIRPQSDDFHDYRGYSGRIASGIFKKGDKVTVLPSGYSSTIKSIDIFEKSIDEAFAPQSVTLTLKDDIDISRGNMIVKDGETPSVSQDVELMICWLSEKPMRPDSKYILRHTTNEVKCVIREIKYKVNINTLDSQVDNTPLELNEIGCIRIRTANPLIFDSYCQNRVTGSLILVDEGTNETLGAGMII